MIDERVQRGVVELDVAVKVGKPVVESGVAGMGRSVLAGL